MQYPIGPLRDTQPFIITLLLFRRYLVSVHPSVHLCATSMSITYLAPRYARAPATRCFILPGVREYMYPWLQRMTGSAHFCCPSV